MASPTIALYFQWSVHDDLCGSDHFPIFLTTHAEDNATHPRYNFKKANWNLFGDLCSRTIDQKILQSDCPVELFTEKNTATAREAIPPYRGGKNLPRVPWFHEECKQAILDRKRAQRKFFKHPTILNFINYKKGKLKVNLPLNSPRLLRGDIMSPQSIPTPLLNQLGRKFEKLKARIPPQKLT